MERGDLLQALSVQIISWKTGLSSGFRSRGAKNHKGTHFKNTILDVSSNRGVKHELGAGIPLPPASSDCPDENTPFHDRYQLQPTSFHAHLCRPLQCARVSTEFQLQTQSPFGRQQ